MASINDIVPIILKWEGGFVDDPDDPGGETNMGVTIKTYEVYCRRKGLSKPTVEDLKAIDMDQWTEILRTMYWNVCKADDIESQSVANMIVDWAWHSGTGTAIRKVQKVVGVARDGIVGPITLAAINSVSALPLFGMLKAERIRHFKDQCRKNPKKKKFLNGWMNRVNDIQFED